MPKKEKKTKLSDDEGKSDVEWKPDHSQIITIEETLQKMKKEEKDES